MRNARCVRVTDGPDPRTSTSRGPAVRSRRADRHAVTLSRLPEHRHAFAGADVDAADASAHWPGWIDVEHVGEERVGAGAGGLDAPGRSSRRRSMRRHHGAEVRLAGGQVGVGRYEQVPGRDLDRVRAAGAATAERRARAAARPARRAASGLRRGSHRALLLEHGDARRTSMAHRSAARSRARARPLRPSVAAVPAERVACRARRIAARASPRGVRRGRRPRAARRRRARDRSARVLPATQRVRERRVEQRRRGAGRCADGDRAAGDARRQRDDEVGLRLSAGQRLVGARDRERRGVGRVGRRARVVEAQRRASDRRRRPAPARTRRRSRSARRRP